MPTFNESFIKKIKQVLCKTIIHRELTIIMHEVNLSVFIKDLKVVKGIIYLQGLRIAGTLKLTTGEEEIEISDVSYKLSLEKEGLISIVITSAIDQLLNSRLKHFNLDVKVVEVEEMIFLSRKRFNNHTKLYITMDNLKF